MPITDMSFQLNPPKTSFKIEEPTRGSEVEDYVDIMRSIGIDPKGDITPEQLDRFNREYNDFLDKRRQKEENYDYEFKEHDAVLARGYNKGGSVNSNKRERIIQTLPLTEEQRKAFEKANSEMQTLPFTEEQRKAFEEANPKMQKYSKGGLVTQYDQLFLEKGKEFGVDPMILKGIASVESNFNPKAEGPKTRSGSAQGMMQFIPAMQKPYGITDPFDPEQSVTGAARMMRDLLKRYKGDVGKALEAYNGGPRLVGKSTQTRQYAEKVQRKAQLFAKSTQKPAIEVAGTVTQGPSALSRTPQVSQQPPKFNAKPKTGELTASLDDLGDEYKAAIALTYLTEDDSDGLTITERAEQLLADQEEDSTIRGDALSQIFTMEPTETEEAGPFDVYAAVQNPQPQQSLPEFNEGGFVFGGTSLPGMPNPFLNYESKFTPEVRNILEGRGPQNEQYQQELAEYQRQVDDYNKGVLQYQDQYKQYEQDLVDYQSQVDAYNNEVNAYNDLAKTYTDQYQGAYNRWLSKAEAYNRQVEQIQQKQKVFDAYADVYNQKVIPLYTNKNLDPPDFNLWAKEVAEGKRFALEPDLYDRAKNKNQSWTDANKNIQLRLGKDPKKPGAGFNPFPGSLESIYANLPTAPEEFKYDDPKVAKPTAPTVTAPTFSKEAPTFSREKPVAPTLTAPNYDSKKLEEVRLAQEDAAKYGKQRELALHVAADPNAYNLAGFGMAEGGAVDKRTALDRVRDFLQALEVTPLDALYATGRAGAGAAVGLMPSSLNEGEDEQLARYRAMAERERSTPQPPMAARSDGSPPYGEDVDMQMFGSTGDRSMDETKKGLGRSVDAIRRGVQYHPADLLGTPVDVINMLLEPVGLGSEKPFMGSEYLIDKGVQAGIYEKPTGEGEETLARFAAGMINPTLGPRAIGKAAEGIETLSRDAMNKGENRMVEKMREMTGNPDLTAKQVYDALLEKQTPGAAAIKPRGGILDLGEGPVIDAAGERLGYAPNTEFSQVQSMAKILPNLRAEGGAEITPEHKQQLMGFVNTKYKKYLQTEFGTEKDPVREVLYGGTRVPRGGMVEGALYKSIDEILEAKGKVAASPNEVDPAFDLARAKSSADYFYDTLTNIRPTMLINVDTLTRTSRKIVQSQDGRDDLNLLIGNLSTAKNENEIKSVFDTFDNKVFKGGLPSDLREFVFNAVESSKKNENLINAEKPDPNNFTFFSGNKAFESKFQIKPLFQKNVDDLNESLKRAVGKEVVYSMEEAPNISALNSENILKTLAAVPREKLNNMSFGQAFKEGTQRLLPFRSFDKAVDDAKAGRSLPKEVLFSYTTPVFDVGIVNKKTGKVDPFKWVKLDDSRQAAIEGALMHHSIGGYNSNETLYSLGGKEAFDTGFAKIYSLRSAEGNPSVSLEYGRPIESLRQKFLPYGEDPDNDLVRQIQGDFNSAPVDYIQSTLAMMKKEGLNVKKNFSQKYFRDRQGNELGRDKGRPKIIIEWGKLQNSFNSDDPNFGITAVEALVGREPFVVITTSQSVQGYNRVKNFNYAKGGMVDKPLYDRAA